MFPDGLTFSCDAGGLGTTVWKGSALFCPSSNNEIVLLHSRVHASNSTCNENNIVAWLIRNGSSTISQVKIINVTPDLNGRNIECFHDNGTSEELLDNFTISYVDTGMHTRNSMNIIIWLYLVGQQLTDHEACAHGI